MLCCVTDDACFLVLKIKVGLWRWPCTVYKFPVYITKKGVDRLNNLFSSLWPFSSNLQTFVFWTSASHWNHYIPVTLNELKMWWLPTFAFHILLHARNYYFFLHRISENKFSNQVKRWKWIHNIKLDSVISRFFWKSYLGTHVCVGRALVMTHCGKT